MISFLRIDESNVTDFASVLPSKLNLSGKAVIGAYDEKDQVLKWLPDDSIETIIVFHQFV